MTQQTDTLGLVDHDEELCLNCNGSGEYAPTGERCRYCDGGYVKKSSSEPARDAGEPLAPAGAAGAAEEGAIVATVPEPAAPVVPVSPYVLMVRNGQIADVIAERKAAADRLAAYRAQLKPIQDDIDAMDHAVVIYAESIDAKKIPHPDYESIDITQGVSEIWNEIRLFQELRLLRINDMPIPENELKSASYMKEPPPIEPTYHKRIPSLNALVKTYGKPVQAIIEKCREYRYSLKRVVYTPRQIEIAVEAEPAQESGAA